MKVLNSKDFLIDVNKPFDSFEIEIEREDSCIILNEFIDRVKVIDFILKPNKAISGSLYYYEDNLREYSKEELREWKERDISLIDSKYDLMEEFDLKGNIEYPMDLNRYEIDKKYEDDLYKIFKLNHSIELSNIGKLDLIRVKLVRSLLNKPFLILLEDITNELDPLEKDEILRELNNYNSIYKVPIIHETKDKTLLKYASKTYIISNDGFVGA